MNINKVNISDKFSRFSDHWHPRIVGELNGQQVKLAKLQGEFVWHSHDHEDEMFLIIKGTLKIELRDKMVEIKEGEFIVIPKGVEHRPIAEEEVQVMLFEPASTLHTGNVETEFTKNKQEWL